MKIKKFLNQNKILILGLVIFIIAFTLRLIAALKIPWRPDEIVYIEWIGDWFSNHFWQYFFQFYHKNFPPNLSTFGNPPLAMWLMTIGIYLAKIGHFSELFGARIVNVLIGSITAASIFYIGKKWFNLGVGIIAGVAYSLAPIIITNNATAYVDTLLALLVLLSFHYCLRYLQEKRSRYLFYLAITLGLAFLTKFVVIPIILVYLIILPIYGRNYPKFWLTYFASIIISASTAIGLWAGLRDPNQITAIYWLYKSKRYAPYLQTYNLTLFNYYLIMLLGILPPIIGLGILINIWLVLKEFINKNLKKYQEGVIIVILIVGYFIYNSIFAKYGGAHQLIPIMPLILIYAALGIVKIINLIKNRKLQLLSYAATILLITLPLTGFCPKYWSLYNNIFVGGPNNAYKIYSVGVDNEGIQEIADYINQNTPEGSQVVIVGYDWILNKYLTGSRKSIELSLNDGLVGAIARGGRYIIIPRVFLEGASTKTMLDFSKIEPVQIIKYKNINLANIYKIDFSNIKPQKKLSIGTQNDWEIQGQLNSPELKFNGEELIINYNFTQDFSQDINKYKSKILLSSKRNIEAQSSRGLFFEVYNDGNDKDINIILAFQNGDYLEYKSALMGTGWRPIYISFEAMNYISKDNINNKADFSKPMIWCLEFTNNKAISGVIKLKNIVLCDDNFIY